MKTLSYTIVKSTTGFAIMQTDVLWEARRGILHIMYMEITCVGQMIPSYEEAEAQLRKWYEKE